VLGNHDERRIASRLGPEQARVAMMLLLTLRGTPTLYYGDELGMLDGDIPPDKVQDPWALLNPGKPHLNRDPARTPMRWSAEPAAGFCAAGVEPWLPVGDELEAINVEAQRGDPRSMLALARALLAARRSSAALSLGRYAALLGATPDVHAFTRVADDGTQAVVVLNFAAEAREVNLGDVDGLAIAVSTHMDRAGEVPGAGGRVALRPHEGCVLLTPRA
jgi:alpha-glucosidase